MTLDICDAKGLAEGVQAGKESEDEEEKTVGTAALRVIRGGEILVG
jgi:hypothetical protein